MLKIWSSTQATVALSSAEAELYTQTKGAAQAFGLMTLLADLGVEVQAAVHTDASAAIGIFRRSGLGRLRHLNATSGSTIQNSAKCRDVFEFSARNVGPKV